jgi:type VI secretion system protein ImpM
VSTVILSGREEARGRSGFYGKLPARGDFVTGALSHKMVEAWHGWLESGLVRSRELIDDGWLDAYLNQPVWRFALSGGLCGEDALAGVMIPNVDKAGRCFPLLVAAILPADAGPVAVSLALGDWYDSAETLVLSSLKAGFVLEEFERQVAALVVATPPAAPVPESDGEPWTWHIGKVCGWHVSTPDGRLEALYASLLDRALGANGDAYSLWWTPGSDRIPPELLVYQGLPDATAFTAFLDGRWDERGWGPRPVLRFVGEDDAVPGPGR